MKTSYFVRFIGFYENGEPTQIMTTIVNITDELTIEKIKEEIESQRLLSIFRKNKSINIFDIKRI